MRYNPRIKRFYERKAAKTNKIVATKAVAHKLARAAYHVMRERVPFDEARAFASSFGRSARARIGVGRTTRV